MPKRTISLSRVTIFSLIALGVITLLISILYVSSFLALFGFALVFWSTILLYLMPANSVFVDLLTSIAQPSLVNIENILNTSFGEKHGLYLFCCSRKFKHLLTSKDEKENKVLFIPVIQNYPLDKFISSPSLDLQICPPGEGLCTLMEKQVGKPFNEMDLSKLFLVLPKILSENLEFVETLDLQNDGDVITVNFTKSVFEGICKEAEKYPRTHQQVGCLLSSAIACALAKAAGEPIMLEKETHDSQESTKLQFRIVRLKED